jgi:hypothetical protein
MHQGKPGQKLGLFSCSVMGHRNLVASTLILDPGGNRNIVRRVTI